MNEDGTVSDDEPTTTEVLEDIDDEGEFIDYESSPEAVVVIPCDPEQRDVREDDVDDEAILQSLHENTMAIIRENLPSVDVAREVLSRADDVPQVIEEEAS